MEILLLIVIAFIAVYVLFIIIRLDNGVHQTSIEPERIEPIKAQCKIESATVVDEKPKKQIMYQLNTTMVKFCLYNAKRDLNPKLSRLYQTIIADNLWINEPFYSEFYRFLLVLEQNNFMIIDKNSNAITVNMRDKNNKMQVSKAYQVFSVQDIAIETIRYALYKILDFQKSDSQNIVIAIFVIVLKQSVHYLSHETPLATIDSLLNNYQYKKNVEHIILLIEQKDSKMIFVHNALAKAFEVCSTFPFNDSELPEPLQIPTKLPVKYLQEI